MVRDAHDLAPALRDERQRLRSAADLAEHLDRRHAAAAIRTAANAIDEAIVRLDSAPQPSISIAYGTSSQCLVTLTDDGAQGFDYTATRQGVLWAKGWVRTRDQRTAELAAKRALAEAYQAHLLSGAEAA